MADLLAGIWGPLATRIRPGRESIRPCGCLSDPVVFGHFHPFGCQGRGVTG